MDATNKKTSIFKQLFRRVALLILVGIIMIGLALTGEWVYQYLTHDLPKTQIKTTAFFATKGVQRVNIDGQEIEFPDDMSQDEIKSVLQKKFSRFQELPDVSGTKSGAITFDDLPDAKKTGAITFDDLIPESIDMHLKEDEETTGTLDSICNAQSPIFVAVTNNSHKIIEYLTFHLSAKRVGRSTVLSDYRIYSSDLIIAPNQSAVGCVDVSFESEYYPLKLKELKYEVKLENVTFRD